VIAIHPADQFETATNVSVETVVVGTCHLPMVTGRTQGTQVFLATSRQSSPSPRIRVSVCTSRVQAISRRTTSMYQSRMCTMYMPSPPIAGRQMGRHQKIKAQTHHLTQNTSPCVCSLVPPSNPQPLKQYTFNNSPSQAELHHCRTLRPKNYKRSGIHNIAEPITTSPHSPYRQSVLLPRLANRPSAPDPQPAPAAAAPENVCHLIPTRPCAVSWAPWSCWSVGLSVCFSLAMDCTALPREQSWGSDGSGAREGGVERTDEETRIPRHASSV
jgi:hypothetical protein